MSNLFHQLDKTEHEWSSNNQDDEMVQRGPVYFGGGVDYHPRLYNPPLLTPSQREVLRSARKYVMEQSIKTVLIKQTISHQQTQMANMQTSLQRQQVITLMCRVYIGSINFNISEDVVREAFVPFGAIKIMSMPYDHVAKHHKGFAFLEYENPEAALMCLQQMNGVCIQGYNIKVCKVGRPLNMPNVDELINDVMEEGNKVNRIYVSSIHPNLSHNDIRSVFESFGRITSLDLALHATTGVHKGYAYIEYERLESALDAVQGLNLFDLGGQRLRVCKALTSAQCIPSQTSCLPKASAIAAAAITAKITALEATGMDSHVTIKSSPPRPSKKFKKFSGFQMPAAETSQLPPPSVYIPPSILSSSSSPHSTHSPHQHHHNPASPPLCLEDHTSLQHQENLQISGHEARKMLMYKLMRNDQSVNNNINENNHTTTTSFKNNINENHTNYNYFNNSQFNNRDEINYKSIDKKYNTTNNNKQNNIKNDNNHHHNTTSNNIRNTVKTNSRVMLLLDMVDEDGVDGELQEEVKGECGRFGEVRKVVIHQQHLNNINAGIYENGGGCEGGGGEGGGGGCGVVVKIFVEFSKTSETEKAISSLNGRFFAGHSIRAHNYDQELYDDNNFSA